MSAQVALARRTGAGLTSRLASPYRLRGVRSGKTPRRQARGLVSRTIGGGSVTRDERSPFFAQDFVVIDPVLNVLVVALGDPLGRVGQPFRNELVNLRPRIDVDGRIGRLSANLPFARMSGVKVQDL